MAVKILIVEDELSLQETIKLNLELEGFRTDVCSNGNEVLSKVRQVSPDIILLDIMLPGKDGLEIYKDAKNEKRSVPVIFLTAKNSTKDKIEGLKLGADDYITKPFDLEELLLRIHNVLKR